MSPFDQEMKLASKEMLSVFGEPLAINAIHFTGIIELVEVEEEVGYRQRIILSVDKEFAELCKKGAKVYSRYNEYKIVRPIQEQTDDEYHVVELIRA